MKLIGMLDSPYVRCTAICRKPPEIVKAEDFSLLRQFFASAEEPPVFLSTPIV